MSVQHVCSCVVLLFTLFGTACSDDAEVLTQERHRLSNKLASSPIQKPSRIKYQQGIVIPCGGASQLANAYVALRVIRDFLLCELPVEISHYGAHEIDDYHRTLFQVRAVHSICSRYVKNAVRLDLNES